MALTAVSSKVVTMLLFIHCLLLLFQCEGSCVGSVVFVFVLGVQCRLVIILLSKRKLIALLYFGVAAFRSCLLLTVP